MPPNSEINLPLVQKRRVNGWMIGTIVTIILCIGLITLSVLLYISYNEQKTDVDGKINDAVSVAKKEQSDIENAKFIERDKEPNREFVGPDDYGRVTFNYPKTWSVYVGKDPSDGGKFEAYLNPKVVPPVSVDQQFAIRVTIEQNDYDKVIASYNTLVKKGDLKVSSVSVDGNNGTRLEGNFSKNIRGLAVLYKIRDKTLTVRTDAETFSADFEKIITSIKFNQ